MEDEPTPWDARLAVLALLLLLTSFWLPWWVVTVDQDGDVLDREGHHLFRDGAPVADHSYAIATGVVVAAAAAVLFVRVAADSRHHEPPKWRRDLWLAAALTLVAAASTSLWPTDVPRFWHQYTVAGGQQVTALPGIGWWLAVVSAGLLAGAAWWARRAASAAVPPATTPK
ncbi:MAG: hypothetical protein ACPGQL_07075 [Thermoplasmatota archaeon]